MNHPNTLLEKLASSSLRRNKSLIVLGALVLLLLGISSVGVQRMIEEQRNTMNFHFARLMEDLHEQETFLHNIAHKSKRDEFSLVLGLSPCSGRQEAGYRVFCLKLFAYSFGERYPRAECSRLLL